MGNNCCREENASSSPGVGLTVARKWISVNTFTTAGELTARNDVSTPRIADRLKQMQAAECKCPSRGLQSNKFDFCPLCQKPTSDLGTLPSQSQGWGAHGSNSTLNRMRFLRDVGYQQESAKEQQQQMKAKQGGNTPPHSLEMSFGRLAATKTGGWAAPCAQEAAEVAIEDYLARKAKLGPGEESVERTQEHNNPATTTPRTSGLVALRSYRALRAQHEVAIANEEARRFKLLRWRRSQPASRGSSAASSGFAQWEPLLV